MTTKEPAAILSLREALDYFLRSAYPVCTSIDPRGYSWCEAYLDQARTEALRIPAPAPGPVLSDERALFEAAARSLDIPTNSTLALKMFRAGRAALASVPWQSEPVSAAPATVDRNAVLEEAAKACEALESVTEPYNPEDCAEVIRTLKSAAPAAQPAAQVAPVSGATSDERSSIATVMANVMFNFAQKCGHTLTDADCELFDKLRKRYGSAVLDVAAPAGAADDAEIERRFHKAGGQWDGNRWAMEDADLHPFVRSIAATSNLWQEGVLMAASIVIASHDMPVVAATILSELGAQTADCSAMDEFDKTSLRKVQGELGGAIALRGLDLPVPDHTTGETK